MIATTKTLFRVLVRTTGSLQPGRFGTVWTREVLYCGYDRLEAAASYHASRPLDYHCGTGNRVRETVGQKAAIQAE